MEINSSTKAAKSRIVNGVAGRNIMSLYAVYLRSLRMNSCSKGKVYREQVEARGVSQMWRFARELVMRGRTLSERVLWKLNYCIGVLVRMMR